MGGVTLTPEIRGFAGTEFCGYGYRYHLKYPGIYPCHSLTLVRSDKGAALTFPVAIESKALYCSHVRVQ